MKREQAVFGPDDWQGNPQKDLGAPGETPFTRGVYPTMYRGKLWTMRQYAGFGTAEETNARFKYLLEQGQTGLSIAFDLATLMGYDTDQPEALGEFGKCGVAVSSLKDMEILLDGIPLDKVSTSMTINSPAAIIWAMYIATAEKQDVHFDRLRGTTQNDILKEYIAQKEYIFPPERSMRLVVDTMEFGSSDVPQWNTISISGYHIREAGATAVQELGFTLAHGIAYCQAAVAAGLSPDEFGGRVSFFFNAHNHFFQEVAKFRAARRLWARVMRERFGATNPKAQALRFHAQTGGSTLTAQQPENNIVRVAVQALSAVCGGAQSIHTNSYDEALALPSERAARVALRTQQILAHEAGGTDTADPLGGAYFIEELTRELEERAWALIEQIDELGGAVEAIEQGFTQHAIEEAAFEHERRVEAGERVVVGVNRFEEGDEEAIELHVVDPDAERRQVERTARVRAEREASAAEAAVSARNRPVTCERATCGGAQTGRGPGRARKAAKFRCDTPFRVPTAPSQAPRPSLRDPCAPATGHRPRAESSIARAPRVCPHPLRAPAAHCRTGKSPPRCWRGRRGPRRASCAARSAWLGPLAARPVRSSRRRGNVPSSPPTA